MQNNLVFPTTYWGKGTEVKFKPLDKMVPTDQITSCFVFAVHEHKLLMIRPERGWGLPGGHREENESPEDCVRREALEEAVVKLGGLDLIGAWEAKKILHTEKNAKYPDLAYQLLYFANVKKIMPFKSDFEILERAFVNLKDVPQLHADYAKFEAIFLYTLDKYKLR
jgi:8-oxo-dGTP diphosphatase